jgi:hypothetical protein
MFTFLSQPSPSATSTSPWAAHPSEQAQVQYFVLLLGLSASVKATLPAGYYRIKRSLLREGPLDLEVLTLILERKKTSKNE